jgi:tetratricopeptide (TPR) repeat protein
MNDDKQNDSNPNAAKKGCCLLIVLPFIIGSIGFIADLCGLNVISVERLKKAGKVAFGIEDFIPAFTIEENEGNLRILVTRFEDYGLEQNDAMKTVCFGRAMESAIGKICLKRNLPISVKFLTECPANHLQANEIGQKNNAEIVLWGKLKNSREGCSAQGITINIQPTNKFKEELERDIQKIDTSISGIEVSAYDIDNDFSILPKDEFYYWLVYFFNQKIGYKDVGQYRIPNSLSKGKKEVWYVERGYLHYNSGLHDRALSDYKNALSLNPKNKQALQAIVNLSSDSLESLKNAKNMVSLFPNESNSHFVLSYTYNNFGDYKRALTAIDIAIKLDSTSSELYDLRGNIFYNLNQYENSIINHSIAILKNSDDPKLYYNRGFSYQSLGEDSLASLDFSKTIQLGLKTDYSYYHYSVVLWRLEKYKDALNEINLTLKLNSKNPSYFQHRGNVFFALDSFDCSVRDYSNAIKLADTIGFYYAYRGYSFRELKRFKEGISDYNKAIMLNSTIGSWHNYRGLCKLEIGEPESAINDFIIATKLDSTLLPSTLNNISRAKTDLGQFKEALSLIDSVFKMKNNEGLAYNYKNRGRALVGLKRFREGVVEFDKAIDKKYPDKKYILKLRSHAKFRSWAFFGA